MIMFELTRGDKCRNLTFAFTVHVKQMLSLFFFPFFYVRLLGNNKIYFTVSQDGHPSHPFTKDLRQRYFTQEFFSLNLAAGVKNDNGTYSVHKLYPS